MDESLSLWMNADVDFCFGSSIVEKTYFSYCWSSSSLQVVLLFSFIRLKTCKLNSCTILFFA